MSEQPYWVGIDVCSATLKITVVEPQTQELVCSDYLRHNAAQARTVQELLANSIAVRTFHAIAKQTIGGLAKNCGACRAGQYAGLARHALDEAGYADIPIITTGDDTKGIHPGFKLSPLFQLRMLWGLAISDALDAMRRRLRPYERKRLSHYPFASLLLGDLADDGVASFVVLSPFGCLPNHISGRGMIKPVKERYPNIHVLSLDHDPDTSFANVENRIQMLVMAAREQHGMKEHAPKQHTKPLSQHPAQEKGFIDRV